MNKISMCGYEFNGCSVISPCEKINDRLAYSCLCFCGVEFTATTKVIRSGAKRSCGCIKRDNAKKHGKSGGKVYTSWAGMIQRCTNINNPKFYRYGERGITVCDRWIKSFDNFYCDMGEPLIKGRFSIGRIDNDEGYSPSNCRWESDIQQANNTSRTRLFLFKGVERTSRSIADEYGLSYDLVYNRLFNGLSDSDVINPHKRGCINE